MSEWFLSMFFSKSFYILDPDLFSLIFFCIWCKVQLHPFVCEYPVVQTPFQDMELSWNPCWNSNDHSHKSLFLYSKFYSYDLYVYPYISTTLVLLL